jgi:hypothetical protein
MNQARIKPERRAPARRESIVFQPAEQELGAPI